MAMLVSGRETFPLFSSYTDIVPKISSAAWDQTVKVWDAIRGVHGISGDFSVRKGGLEYLDVVGMGF